MHTTCVCVCIVYIFIQKMDDSKKVHLLSCIYACIQRVCVCVCMHCTYIHTENDYSKTKYLLSCLYACIQRVCVCMHCKYIHTVNWWYQNITCMHIRKHAFVHCCSKIYWQKCSTCLCVYHHVYIHIFMCVCTLLASKIKQSTPIHWQTRSRGFGVPLTHRSRGVGVPLTHKRKLYHILKYSYHKSKYIHTRKQNAIHILLCLHVIP
jgi:hypothetical protein